MVRAARGCLLLAAAAACGVSSAGSGAPSTAKAALANGSAKAAEACERVDAEIVPEGRPSRKQER